MSLCDPSELVYSFYCEVNKRLGVIPVNVRVPLTLVRVPLCLVGSILYSASAKPLCVRVS